jgi:predicted  nucleic acid-binding Zn-ribbon protein
LSIPDQIHALEELAAIDADLRTLDETLSQERGVLSGLKANLKKLEERLETSKSAVTANDKTRNDAITDVRTMMQQLEHSREKLGRARTERESNAVQRELEELRKLVRDREDEIGKLTTEGDAHRQTIETLEADIAKVREQLGSSEGDIHSKLGETEGERTNRAQGRDAVVKKLPTVLYRRYETIRAKRGTGIAAVTVDGTCSACNMALAPQLFHRLRREPLLEQCPSCNRIIYFLPPVAAAKQSS